MNGLFFFSFCLLFCSRLLRSIVIDFHTCAGDASWLSMPESQPFHSHSIRSDVAFVMRCTLHDASDELQQLCKSCPSHLAGIHGCYNLLITSTVRVIPLIQQSKWYCFHCDGFQADSVAYVRFFLLLHDLVDVCWFCQQFEHSDWPRSDHDVRMSMFSQAASNILARPVGWP